MRERIQQTPPEVNSGTNVHELVQVEPKSDSFRTKLRREKEKVMAVVGVALVMITASCTPSGEEGQVINGRVVPPTTPDKNNHGPVEETRVSVELSDTDVDIINRCLDKDLGLDMSGMARRIDGEEPGQGRVEVCSSQEGWVVVESNPWEAGDTPKGFEGVVLAEDLPGMFPEAAVQVPDSDGEVTTITDDGTLLLRIVTPDGYMGFAELVPEDEYQPPSNDVYLRASK